MRLVEVKANNRGRYPRHGIMLLQVSVQEALSLVRSLVGQIQTQEPNSQRLETFLEDGRDFSISVHPPYPVKLKE